MKASLLLSVSQAAVLLALLPPALRAQGPLAPPGPPGPAMRSLSQVEPRFPVSAAPVTLGQPGSYYLTTNLSGRITVAADSVSLDLMGFSVIGTSGGAIVQAAPVKNLLIHNGVVSAPEGNGINLGGSASNANGRIENVRVSDCQAGGIIVGDGFLVEGCQVWGTGLAGIRVNGSSTVRRCTVEGCGVGLYLTGTGALVEENVVRGNADNYDFAPGNRLNLLLCEIPETLAWPCHAKLAGTLVMAGAGTGIQVSSDNVSIDLGGHALVGPGTLDGYGINQTASYKNLEVRNGSVVNWGGFGYMGIYAGGAANRLADLTVATNYFGVWAGSGAVVERCAALNNETTGLSVGEGSSIVSGTLQGNADGAATEVGCSVFGCAASGNRERGFYIGHDNVVSSCAAYGNGLQGFVVEHGCSVADCSAYANGSSGYRVGSGCAVSRCSAAENAGCGFELNTACVVKECAALSNDDDGYTLSDYNQVTACNSNNNGSGAGAGFHIPGSVCRVEGCAATSNGLGFDVDGVKNFIARNTASGNTTNWTVAAGNVCLVVQAVTGGAFAGSSGGVAPGSADPCANFSH